MQEKKLKEKERKLKQKEREKWWRIKKRYNLTKEEYEKIYKEQDGRCYICQRTEKQIKKSKSKYLAVDHCHKTGKIRGLLCTYCNRSLSQFLKDDPEKIMRTYIYVVRKTDYGKANTAHLINDSRYQYKNGAYCNATSSEA